MPDGVLVVEDDPDLREGLAEILAGEGYQVLQAADGQEALETIAERAPCLVLLDLMMPVMDGWTLRRELLANPATSNLPVVVLSGVSDVAGEASGLDAVAYLKKPVDLDQLLELVADHC